MSEINETIQEAVSHAGENKINSMVAIWVALTATFMALCNIKDGNIVQAMSQAQAHAIDAWSYFQAKSTKQSIAENTVELLKMQKNKDSENVITKYTDKIAAYEKEKNKIKIQAEGFQKEYDDINVFDDQFDMTEAFVSIAIAMFGITALTQKKMASLFCLWYKYYRNNFGINSFHENSITLRLYFKIIGLITLCIFFYKLDGSN